MASPEETPEPYYIAYIDEAGDPGLNRIRPRDPDGSSEWLVLGATVIRAETEPQVVEWVRTIRKEIRATQGPDLHFRKLSDERKRAVCELVAPLKLKSFAVLSNKKNMKGHRNKAAERFPAPRGWFYNFCARLLIERVSDYCERMSIRAFGEPRKVKLIFANAAALSTIGSTPIFRFSSFRAGRTGYTCRSAT